MLRPQLSPAIQAAADETLEASCNVKNRNGQTLTGTLHQASEIQLCVLCHGLLADKNAVFLPELASHLAAQGISSYR